MLSRLLALAAAGALGTLSRYGLSNLADRYFGESFAWGTLSVNAVGCFLFGAVWSLSQEHLPISAEMRTILLVGFAGAFTTFSTLAFETNGMLQSGDWLGAVLNLAANTVFGLGLLLLGLAAGSAVGG